MMQSEYWATFHVTLTLGDLDPKVKVKGQIMYFLVNVSPPKPSDIATSIFEAK